MYLQAMSLQCAKFHLCKDRQGDRSDEKEGEEDKPQQCRA